MACCIVCQCPAAVYCENDLAFLCTDCDVKIHSSNAVASRHSRVRVCESCHKVASTVYCKNDRAFLCDACDTEIHLNNPLASRHEVVPAKSAMMEAATSGTQQASPARSEGSAVFKAACECVDVCRSVCSLSVPEVPCMDTTSTLACTAEVNQKPCSKEFDEMMFDNTWMDRLDAGFDFSDILSDSLSDGLVPSMALPGHSTPSDSFFERPLFPTLDFDPKPTQHAQLPETPASAPKPTPPPSQHLPTTSLAPNAPKTATVAAPKPTIATLPPAATVVPESTIRLDPIDRALDRKARVARWLEKRKRRKFEKTIRYECRKAYAEVRPRVKGRFVKREQLPSAWPARHETEADLHSINDNDAFLVPDMFVF